MLSQEDIQEAYDALQSHVQSTQPNVDAIDTFLNRQVELSPTVTDATVLRQQFFKAITNCNRLAEGSLRLWRAMSNIWDTKVGNKFVEVEKEKNELKTEKERLDEELQKEKEENKRLRKRLQRQEEVDNLKDEVTKLQTELNGFKTRSSNEEMLAENANSRAQLQTSQSRPPTGHSVMSRGRMDTPTGSEAGRLSIRQRNPSRASVLQVSKRRPRTNDSRAERHEMAEGAPSSRLSSLAPITTHPREPGEHAPGQDSPVPLTQYETPNFDNRRSPFHAHASTSSEAGRYDRPDDPVSRQASSHTVLHSSKDAKMSIAPYAQATLSPQPHQSTPSSPRRDPANDTATSGAATYDTEDQGDEEHTGVEQDTTMEEETPQDAPDWPDSSLVRNFLGEAGFLRAHGTTEDLRLFNDFLDGARQAEVKTNDRFTQSDFHVIDTALTHYNLNNGVSALEAMVRDRNWKQAAQRFAAHLSADVQVAGQILASLLDFHADRQWECLRLLVYRIGQERHCVLRIGLATRLEDGSWSVVTEPAIMDQSSQSATARILWLVWDLEVATGSQEKFYYAVADTMYTHPKDPKHPKRTATASPGASALLGGAKRIRSQSGAPEDETSPSTELPAGSAVTTSATPGLRDKLRSVTDPARAVVKETMSKPQQAKYPDPDHPLMHYEHLGWGRMIHIGPSDGPLLNAELFPPTLRGYLRNQAHIKNHFNNNKIGDKPVLRECFWSTARHDDKGFVGGGEDASEQEGPCEVCANNDKGEQRLCCVLIDEQTVLWKGWGKDTNEVKRQKKEAERKRKEEEKKNKEQAKAEKVQGKGRKEAPTRRITRGQTSDRPETGDSDTPAMDAETQQAARAGQRFLEEESSGLSDGP